MEKINYGPLIRMLRQKRDECNRLFSACSIQYPSLDSELVKAWVVDVIQPLMQELHTLDEKRFEAVFDALYETILNLAGSFRLQTRGDVYRSALMLMPRIPENVMDDPGDITRSFVQAVDTLMSSHPDSVDHWIQSMNRVLPLCSTYEHILDAGRLCAWKAGLAHLKERAVDTLKTLPPEVVASVLNVNGVDTLKSSLWEHPWLSPGDTDTGKPTDVLTFRYRTGGFRGYGGPFLKPPVVACMEKRFVATDGESCCAMFADVFGVSVLSNLPVSPSEVTSSVRNIGASSPLMKVSGGPRPITDISSQAFDGKTLVLTRESSHFLYIYG